MIYASQLSQLHHSAQRKSKCYDVSIVSNDADAKQSKRKIKKMLDFMNTTTLDRTRDTMHIIPANTEVVMFCHLKEADNKLCDEIDYSQDLVLDRDKVFNGSFLLVQTVCACGCGKELAIFHYDSCDHQATFFQANVEDIQSMSRNDYNEIFECTE